jgi:NADPH:quinone reductase-like Zn-dependent oxidoreductase
MAETRTIYSLGVEQVGQPYLFRYEEGPPPPDHFRVETHYTGISTGTEMTFLQGSNPYLHATWDQTLGIFRADQAGMRYPVPFLGYMEVGQVVESRTTAVSEGELVAMAYGHKTGHTAHAQHEFYRRLPADFDPLLGIYVAQMGPICANGLLYAAAEVVGHRVRDLGDGVRGRTVLVIGGGVVGLLTALFARAWGAAEVALVSGSAPRLAAAQAFGLLTVDDQEHEPWHFCKTRWCHGPGDCGADLVFQCKADSASLHMALRSLRPRGTVIDMAFYQGGAPDLRLGEEFHHNGLTIRCAQINNRPIGLEYTWTRARLANETIDLLQTYGALWREQIITDVVPFAESPAFFAKLAAVYQPQVIQAVLVTR